MNSAVIPVVRPAHAGGYMQCRTWLIPGAGGAALVDPGSGVEEDSLLANLRQLGCSPSDIRYLLITHAHVDHAMGAGRLRRWGAKIVASAYTARLMEGASPVVWGEHPELVRPVTVDVRVADGEELDCSGFAIGCHLTPGHTHGCVTYMVETADGRAGFTGDIVMGDGRPGWAGPGEYSASETVASLEKLRGIRVACAYPGHGAPITDPEAWLQRALALGRGGEWNPGCEWNYLVVPPALRQEQERSAADEDGSQ
jgi:glyoxylase-like metal-dependent hydrolase (beta-lactamase superfamily II)